MGVVESLVCVGLTATETNANAASSASASEDVVCDEFFECCVLLEVCLVFMVVVGECVRCVDVMCGVDWFDVLLDVLFECVDVFAET